MRTLRIWITVLAGLMAALPASAKTTLDMSIWISHQAPFVKDVMLVWAKQVEDATDGRVAVRLLPKAVASPAQHFDAVRDGLADVSFTVHGYTPGRFALTKMAELPFLGDSAEAISVAYNKVYFERLASANEHAGVKLLAVFAHGPGHIFTTRVAPRSIVDLRGMKLRTGGGIVNMTVEAIGATALMKPANEQYELIASGIADGTMSNLQSIVSFRLAPLVKHAVLVPGGLFNSSFMLMMNEKKFDALEARDREAILKVSGEQFARLAGRVFDRTDEAGLAALRAAGAQVTQISPEFLAELKTAAQSVEASWMEEVKDKGVDAKAALKEMRAAIQAAERR